MVRIAHSVRAGLKVSTLDQVDVHAWRVKQWRRRKDKYNPSTDSTLHFRLPVLREDRKPSVIGSNSEMRRVDDTVYLLPKLGRAG